MQTAVKWIEQRSSEAESKFEIIAKALIILTAGDWNLVEYKPS